MNTDKENPSQAARVDEDAVERACRSMYPEWPKYHQHERETFRKEMRAALEAALSAQPAQLSWAQGIGHEGGHYDQPAKGLAGEVVAMRDAVGVCRDGIQARIAELEAAQPAEQGEAVAFCRVEDVDNNDSHLAQLGVKRGDKLYLRPAAPMGVPDESIEENGKWYVLMDGARYEVSRIEADGWDYCVSYLQKLNAATSPAPQGEAIGVIVDADLLRKNQPVTAYPLSHPGAASMTKLYLHSAAPVGGPIALFTSEEAHEAYRCLREHNRSIPDACLDQMRDVLLAAADDDAAAPSALAIGTLCSVCYAPQFDTPSGVSCPNGHGGAAPSAPQGNAGLGIPSCGKPLCSENDHHPLCPSAPQGVECQHSWVTDGINPTCCSKCKRPAMPTHHTERK